MSQMDDHDLDQLGRMAAAHTRAEARAIADSPSALRELLAGEMAAPTATPTTLPVERMATPGRPRWQLAAVAAVIGAFALGLGWALVNGVGGTIDIVGPTGTGAGLPDGSAAPATSAPATTSPENTTPGIGTGAAQSTVPTTGSVAPASTPDSTTADTTPTVDDGPGVLVVGSVAPIGPDAARPLLPDPAPPQDRTYRSLDVAGSGQASILQTWIRSDTDGTVTGVLGVDGGNGPHPLPLVGDPVELPGWDSAVRVPSANVAVRAQAGDLYVSIVVEGVAEDEALAIIRSLRTVDRRWFTASLDDDWIELQRQWRGGTAARILTTLSPPDGDVDTVLEVRAGTPLFDLIPSIADDDVRLVTMTGGTTGILSRGGVSALVFVDDSGNIVRLGSRDPAADLLTVAASLSVVDEAVWEAAAQPWPDGVDGCVGLFC